MKTFLLNSFFIVGIIALVLLLPNCKKETECKVIVTVKYYHDTTIVVPDADVLIKKFDTKSSGKSNSAGVYEATFKYEAILDVFAEKDTSTMVHNPPVPPLTGAAVVRLQPGKTVQKTVFIQ